MKRKYLNRPSHPKKIFAQMAIGGFDLASYSLKSLFHRVVFSLEMENIKEEDKKSLEQDANFKKILTESNAQFKNHYNAFHK